MEKIISTDKCPECGKVNLINDTGTGEVVCNSCGLVVREIGPNEGPEWRAYNPIEYSNRSRATAIAFGAPGVGSATVISPRSRDVKGAKLPAETMSKFRRLRRQERKATFKHSDRTLVSGYSTIQLIGNALALPNSVKDTAYSYFCKAKEVEIIRGRSVRGVSGACIYASCKDHDIVRSMKEIAKGMDMDRKRLFGVFSELQKRGIYKQKRLKLSRFLSKAVDNMDLSGNIVDVCMKLLEGIEKEGFTVGQSPPGVVAGILYISGRVTGDFYDQGTISVALGVTEVTIRNRYKKILQYLMVDVKL